MKFAAPPQAFCNGDRVLIPLCNAEIAEALDFARYAIETSGEDPDTLARAAGALAFLGREHAAATRAIERALALNPNCAYAWAIAARVHCIANRPDAAIAATEKAMQLSPVDPLHFVNEWMLGFGLMLGGCHPSERTACHPTQSFKLGAAKGSSQATRYDTRSAGRRAADLCGRRRGLRLRAVSGQSGDGEHLGLSLL